MRLKDRPDGGKQLAEKLMHYRGSSFVEVVGLARGGVVVAAEIARVLNLPLSVIAVRHIHSQDHPNHCPGALAQDGSIAWNEQVCKSMHIGPESCAQSVAVEKQVLETLVNQYRSGDLSHLKDKTVLLVDDGIITGASMRAAISCIRAAGASKIVVATPMGDIDGLKTVEPEADSIVCLDADRSFLGVAPFYDTFEPVTDQDVVRLLREARDRMKTA